jgi:hypothetical protein
MMLKDKKVQYLESVESNENETLVIEESIEVQNESAQLEKKDTEEIEKLDEMNVKYEKSNLNSPQTILPKIIVPQIRVPNVRIYISKIKNRKGF